MNGSTERTPRKISMGYRIDSKPSRMTTGDVIRALIDATRTGTGVLPSGLCVTWSIRHQDFDFGYIVRTANGPLRSMMTRRLLRDLVGAL